MDETSREIFSTIVIPLKISSTIHIFGNDEIVFGYSQEIIRMLKKKEVNNIVLVVWIYLTSMHTQIMHKTFKLVKTICGSIKIIGSVITERNSQ